MLSSDGDGILATTVPPEEALIEMSTHDPLIGSRGVRLLPLPLTCAHRTISNFSDAYSVSDPRHGTPPNRDPVRGRADAVRV
jgi:hypothetical protein